MENREVDSFQEKLLLKFFQEELDQEEQGELEAFLENSETDRDLFDQLYQISRTSEAIVFHKTSRVEIALRKLSEKISLLHRFSRIKSYFFKAAAILLFPLIAAVLYLTLDNASYRKTGMNEVVSLNRKVSVIKLQDGSIAYLHSGSKLQYPDRFGKKERCVKLDGEAYFEVKSDKKNPFWIQTGDGSRVKVTGTKFNVSAYRDDPSIIVYLKEGRLEFEYPETNLSAQISPGMRLIFDKANKSYTIEQNTDKENISWKDGKLIFNETPASEVVRVLSHHFGVDIHVKDQKLENCRFKATFRDESLQQILNMLKVSTPGLAWSVKEVKDATGKKGQTIELFLIGDEK